MTPKTSRAVGIRYGLFAGLLYVILLLCRYKLFSANPASYFTCTLLSYFIILLVFLFAGMARKKELGGYAEVRELFQTMFIAILIAELIFILFVFIYMKFIDPGYMNTFRMSSLAYFHQLNLSNPDIDMRMKGIDSLAEQAKPAGLIKGYGMTVVIDSIFGFLFAFILRKQKPGSAEPNP